jgi:hypothetical protein
MTNKLDTMQTIGDQMSQILQNMSYQAAGYESSQNRLDVTTKPGFTLIKDSYFPHWQTKQGNIMPTTQGFTLINSDDIRIVLNYKEPFVYPIATCITIVTLSAALAILAGATFLITRRYSLF